MNNFDPSQIKFDDKSVQVEIPIKTLAVYASLMVSIVIFSIVISKYLKALWMQVLLFLIVFIVLLFCIHQFKPKLPKIINKPTLTCKLGQKQCGDVCIPMTKICDKKNKSCNVESYNTETQSCCPAKQIYNPNESEITYNALFNIYFDSVNKKSFFKSKDDVSILKKKYFGLTKKNYDIPLWKLFRFLFGCRGSEVMKASNDRSEGVLREVVNVFKKIDSKFGNLLEKRISNMTNTNKYYIFNPKLVPSDTLKSLCERAVDGDYNPMMNDAGKQSQNPTNKINTLTISKIFENGMKTFPFSSKMYRNYDSVQEIPPVSNDLKDFFSYYTVFGTCKTCNNVCGTTCCPNDSTCSATGTCCPEGQNEDKFGNCCAQSMKNKDGVCCNTGTFPNAEGDCVVNCGGTNCEANQVCTKGIFGNYCMSKPKDTCKVTFETKDDVMGRPVCKKDHDNDSEPVYICKPKNSNDEYFYLANATFSNHCSQEFKNKFANETGCKIDKNDNTKCSLSRPCSLPVCSDQTKCPLPENPLACCKQSGAYCLAGECDDSGQCLPQTYRPIKSGTETQCISDRLQYQTGRSSENACIRDQCLKNGDCCAPGFVGTTVQANGGKRYLCHQKIPIQPNQIRFSGRNCKPILESFNDSWNQVVVQSQKTHAKSETHLIREWFERKYKQTFKFDVPRQTCDPVFVQWSSHDDWKNIKKQYKSIPFQSLPVTKTYFKNVENRIIRGNNYVPHFVKVAKMLMYHVNKNRKKTDMKFSNIYIILLLTNTFQQSKLYKYLAKNKKVDNEINARIQDLVVLNEKSIFQKAFILYFLTKNERTSDYIKILETYDDSNRELTDVIENYRADEMYKYINSKEKRLLEHKKPEQAFSSMKMYLQDVKLIKSIVSQFYDPYVNFFKSVEIDKFVGNVNDQETGYYDIFHVEQNSFIIDNKNVNMDEATSSQIPHCVISKANDEKIEFVHASNLFHQKNPPTFRSSDFYTNDQVKSFDFSKCLNK